MLNVRKKYLCSFKELFNVNLYSYFCIKYIINYYSKYSQICSVPLWIVLKTRKYTTIIQCKAIDGHIHSTKKQQQQQQQQINSYTRLKKVCFEIMSAEIKDMFKYLW